MSKLKGIFIMLVQLKLSRSLFVTHLELQYPKLQQFILVFGVLQLLLQPTAFWLHLLHLKYNNIRIHSP